MTAPDHLKITGPEDILGFIPHSLGYWPDNSLVAMTLQGKRLGATLRVDLPEPSRCRGPALAAFARTVRDYLEADEEADGTLLAIFSAPGDTADGGGPADGGPPGAGGDVPDDGISPSLARLLGELELTLGAAGLPVRDAWLIGERYWRNAHCIDPSCCAPPGRPIEEIRNSRLNAELVFRGSSVGAAPGRSARGRPSAGDPPAPVEPAALEAEQGWAREFSGRWRNRAQFQTVLEVWERVLDAATRLAGHTSGRRPAGVPAAALPAGLAGYLRATLCVAPWRDAVLVMAAAGRAAAEAGADEFGVFDAGPDEPAPLPELEGFPPAAVAPGPAPGEATTAGETPGYGDVLLGLLPPAPDWARLAGLDRVLSHLGGCGGGEAKAAALTGRGWIEWCRGRGSFADALFTAAAAEEPGYRLAELLAELGRRGTLCGWARRRDAAWQKFDPDAA